MIKLVINPSAHGISKNKIKQIIDNIKIYHADIDVIFTSEDQNNYKKKFLENIDMCSKLIIAGGDGTLNNVLNILLKNNITAKPIALIPSGTANIFAHEELIPFDLKKSIHNIFHSETKFLDIGLITDQNNNQFYFLLMAGVGLDAHAVMNVNEKVKKITGKISYVLSGLKNIFKYKPKQILIKTDKGNFSGTNVIVSNVKTYGAKNYCIAPLASQEDGLLDLCIFTSTNNLNFLKHIFTVRFGTHLKCKDVLHETIKYAEISSINNEEILFQFDGEKGTCLPIKISVLPKKIPFILRS